MADGSTIPAEARQFLDPRWRLSNLYWITDKRGQRVKFEPNSAQLDFLDNLHSRNIILKARQLGFTTLCCLIYLDAAVFTPDTRAAVIAHRLDDAKIIFRDKIKFPYENLPEGIRNEVPLTQDAADTLHMSNNSSVRCSVSARSGTLQWLHISEFGKICAQYPQKAREILTGSLPALAPGGFGAIESTAEGPEGAFFEMSEAAQKREADGAALSPLDFKFHFFPWWRAPEYVDDPARVTIGPKLEKYFATLKTEHGINLTPEQKAWYAKTAATVVGDMGREYPSTADEAFAESGDDAFRVIPPAWIRIAQDRWDADGARAVAMTSLGVDVAQGGSDKTTMVRRHDWWFSEVESWPGEETPDGPSIAALVVPRLRDGAAVHIDVGGGWGNDAYRVLKEANVAVAGLSGAERSHGNDRSGKLKFANKRAEWWWGFREALDPERGAGLALPPGRELVSDLSAPRYTIRDGGRLLIESKADIRARLGRSPDMGDAVVYAYAVAGIATGGPLRGASLPAQAITKRGRR